MVTRDEAVPGVRRVLVIDDHRSFAELLARALSGEPDLECVGVAHTVGEAAAAAAETRPEIVLLDIELDNENGLNAARQIRTILPEVVIVVVTAHRDPSWITRASQAGAIAFAPKNGSLRELLDVLRRARPGGMLVAPSAFGAAAAQAVAAGSAARRRPDLTPRERQVLACLARGLPPKVIARELGISVNTSRGYVKALLAKLQVRSQLEAVVRAQESGLIDSPPG
jgi:DNA-binding NarL/FixJ family response regulator